MIIDSFAQLTPSDASATQPGALTVGGWREADTLDHLVFVDENVAALRLEDIWSDASPGDHSLLTNLAADDHAQYHTDARHTTEHDATYNNALLISGDVASKTTLGAHVAATETHWYRPAQSHLVAKNATGQYATIQAAVTAANAAASGSSQQEVVIYPGIYDENNITVNDYVSLRSVIPWHASIAPNSANPVFKLEGNNVVDGVNVNNQGGGSCFELKTAGTGEVLFDQVSALSASGAAIDYNGSSQNLNIKNGSRIQSETGTLISAKTASSSLVVRSSLFDYGGSAVVAALIDIDDNSAVFPDIFESCQFYADNLISGGAAIGAFFDWDANTLRIMNSYFRLAAPATKDVRGIHARSGTVDSQGNAFFWVLTAGTPYDYYTETGAQINTLASAYDFAKVGGTGTVATTNQGDFAGDNLTLTGQLSMTGDDTNLVDLRPTGTDPQAIISIIPQNPIDSAGAWSARFVDGANLDPSIAGVVIKLDSVDLSTIDQTFNPLIIGSNIAMPGSYTSTSNVVGALITGDSRTVELCNDDHAIEAIAATDEAGKFVFSGAETTAIKEPLCIEQRTTGNMADGYGAGARFVIQDVAGVANNIAGISGRRDGADTTGKLSFFCGAAGAVENLIIFGDNQISMPQARSAGTGLLVDGQGFGGEIYDDGVGLTINAAGGDPIIIGESVFVQLGDNAGVEDFAILDSGSAVVAWINSNGQVATPKIFHPTDSNTSILFTGGDGMVFDAGGVEMLRFAEGATDEVVVNEDALDVNFRVEAVGPVDAIAVDGATGDVTFGGEINYGQKYILALQVPLVGVVLGPSANPDLKKMIDDGAGSTGVFQYAFDQTTEEELFFSGEVDFGYDEGSDLAVHIHWAPDGTGGANEFVQWGLEYAWRNIDGTFTTSTIIYTDASAAGTATTSGDTAMTDLKFYQSEFPAISGSGMERCSGIIGRIFRDATDADDDYPNDAFGIVLDFDVIVDQPGLPV